MNSSDWSAHTSDMLSQSKEYTHILLKYTFFLDRGNPALLSAKRSKNVEEENGEGFYQQEHQI